MTSSRGRRVAGACLLPLVAGAFSCSFTPLPPAEEGVSSLGQCIMGGIEDLNHAAVVGIALVDAIGRPLGLCTGSLIAPNLVLTARHCVAQTNPEVQCDSSAFGSTYAASRFYITTAYNGPELAMASMSSIQMSGSWSPAAQVMVSGQNELCGNDVALIRLRDSVPASRATPMTPRVDIPVSDDELYTAIGFGATDEAGSGFGRRRILEDLAVECVGNCLAWNVNNEREWQGEKGICQGDSGGPAIDASGRVVGVVSRGNVGCLTPVYGSVFGWADWIKQNAVAAAKAGGYPTPGWALGEPTGPDVGTGGAAGSGGAGPELAGLGEPCSGAGDCESGLCVSEDAMTLYCSQACSAESPDCPAGMVCAVTQGACVRPGGFSSACTGNSDCRSQVCVSGDSGDYCSQACAADTDCPRPATCALDPGVCVLPPPSAAQGASSSSSGCALAGAFNDDPTKPIPWCIGAGLLALSLVRRRQRS